MALFTATGTIATDIVRRETRNGVLATFRLAAGQPGRGQLWIDIEAWGHLAGTVNQHGHSGQHILLTGRVTHKTWPDPTTGDARARHVVTALDVDFLSAPEWEPTIANAVMASGVVDTTPAVRLTKNGCVTEFSIRSGRAGTKSGRLWLPVEHWSRTDAQPAIGQRQHVVVHGRLAYRSATSEDGPLRGRFYVASRELTPVGSPEPSARRIPVRG